MTLSAKHPLLQPPRVLGGLGAGFLAGEGGEPVDLQEVLLTAWLHDVDDYKLVGKAQAEELTNAVNIMTQAKVFDGLSQAVLENIAAIGYSKRLNGRQP